MINNIFDTHAHYADRAFDGDREEILATLPEKGVKYVALAASSVEDSAENSALAEKYDYIFSAAGVHPESIDSNPENYLETLEKIITNNKKVKAVGEIGLDYHYDGYDREKQIKLFSPPAKRDDKPHGFRYNNSGREKRRPSWDYHEGGIRE